MDKSSNGTSVNGVVIGKDKEKVLDHNALISIAKTKVYVFMVIYYVFGVARDGAISLQTLVCDIKTECGTRQVVVLLDSGSNSSLIDQDLASKLKAEVRDGPIVRKVNYVDRQVEVRSDLVSFELINPDTNYSRAVLAWTVKDLAKRSNVVDWSRTRNKF